MAKPRVKRPRPADDMPAPVTREFARVLSCHRAQLGALQERAAGAARAEVRHLLRMLRARFPRHGFRFVQGMGAKFLEVKRDAPAGFRRFRNWLVSPCDVSPIDCERGPAAERYLCQRVAAVFAVADFLESEFDSEVGDVRA